MSENGLHDRLLRHEFSGFLGSATINMPIRPMKNSVPMRFGNASATLWAGDATMNISTNGSKRSAVREY